MDNLSGDWTSGIRQGPSNSWRDLWGRAFTANGKRHVSAGFWSLGEGEGLLSIWRLFLSRSPDAIHPHIDQWDWESHPKWSTQYRLPQRNGWKIQRVIRLTDPAAEAASQILSQSKTNYLRSHRRIMNYPDLIQRAWKCHATRSHFLDRGIAGEDGKPHDADVHLTTMTGQQSSKMATRAWMVILVPTF